MLVDTGRAIRAYIIYSGIVQLSPVFKNRFSQQYFIIQIEKD
jgi:hypothetical protein